MPGVVVQALKKKNFKNKYDLILKVTAIQRICDDFGVVFYIESFNPEVFVIKGVSDDPGKWKIKHNRTTILNHSLQSIAAEIASRQEVPMHAYDD